MKKARKAEKATPTPTRRAAKSGGGASTARASGTTRPAAGGSTRATAKRRSPARTRPTTQLSLVPEEAVAVPEPAAPPDAPKGKAPSTPEPKPSAKRGAAAANEPSRRRTAAELATKQREISVSEFFTKNRHLLGFDSPSKALLTTVKEAVDNSFDACEEAGILPEITISLFELSETRFRVVVEDNGPGIVQNQIPKIFGQLLYGSKFHRLRQSLTGDQRVLIERQGRVERIPIGQLVDDVLEPGEDVGWVAGRGWRVPGFHLQTGLYSWWLVAHVIRHRRENEILEVITEQERRVRVTGCHSLFACRPETFEIYPIEVRSLKVGDTIVAPNRIPSPDGAWGGSILTMPVMHQTRRASQVSFDSDVAGKQVATMAVDEEITLESSDLSLLRVEEIRHIENDDAFVYDLSVPGCENFVAGEGLLACHNSRGQQGIGISAAGMYGQLTTGKPIIITSRTGPKKPAHHFEIQIDTRRNQPVVVKDTEVDWPAEHGTRVELEIEATYKKGKHSVDGYIELTALANPHATISYHSPKGEAHRYERVAHELPREPKEIQPHPHGIELGILLRMLQDTKARNVTAFLTGEFSRVSPKVAEEILTSAHIAPTTSPGKVSRNSAEALFKAIGATKLMAPPTNCLSPIGDEALRAGLAQQGPADFVAAVTRPPAVYRGNPFQVEVGIAYGGERPGDELAELVRFANRVPLLYQQSACAITRAVLGTSWKSYGIQQSRGALPAAPMLIMVHIASVWVPFTSESKEAIASYPEILKEIKLGLQDCGRRLGIFLRRGAKLRDAELKRSYIEKYIPHIGIALKEILGLSDKEEAKVVDTLKDTLERSRTP